MNVPDHFELLGLSRRFDVDLREVERIYLAKSRELHPDFHANATTGERLAAAEMASRLNEAVNVIRDPFRRAEHLMALLGGPTAGDQKQMPPEFLEEVLDLRMQIEELRETEAMDSPDFRAMEEGLEVRRNRLLDGVGPGLGEALAMPAGSEREARLKQVRSILNAIKYLQGLLSDLRADP